MGDFRAFRPFRGLLLRSSAIVPAIKPVAETQPAITPESGSVGTVFTITLATYSGSPTPLRVFRLMLGLIDVTSQMVGLTYTSDEPGTLTWEEFAVNSAGTGPANPATATIAAAAGAQPDKPGATSWTLTPGEEAAIIDVASLLAGAVTVQF